MEKYTTIDTIYLARLNNAEYLFFMNSMLNLIPYDNFGDDDRPIIESPDAERTVKGAAALGLSAGFLANYNQDVALLADVVNKSRIAQETEEAALHEKNRDSLTSYITTHIVRSASLPIEAERDAGKFLYKVTKPYMNIIRLPAAQETAKIQGLLLDLRKEENAPYVTILGLDGYLSELEKENNAYVAAVQQRTESRASNKKESSEVLRRRIDEQYKTAALLAQSFSIAVPSEAATTFVDNLNQLIHETMAAYNMRGKKKKEEDDRPVIEQA